MIELLDAVASGAVERSDHLRTYVEVHYRGLQTLALWAFAACNSVRMLAYVLQFLKAVHDDNGATAISFATWGLFLVSNITTVFYALICLGDPLMVLIFTANALACTAILIATRVKRRSYRQRTGMAPAD